MANCAAIRRALSTWRDKRKRHPPFTIVISNTPLPANRPDRIHRIALLTENMFSGQSFALRHEINHRAANFHRPHKIPLLPLLLWRLKNNFTVYNYSISISQISVLQNVCKSLTGRAPSGLPAFLRLTCLIFLTIRQSDKKQIKSLIYNMMQFFLDPLEIQKTEIYWNSFQSFQFGNDGITPDTARPGGVVCRISKLKKNTDAKSAGGCGVVQFSSCVVLFHWHTQPCS